MANWSLDKSTPSSGPVYLVLAPGRYRISQPITIDRVGAVYIHGLSMAGILLTDSTNFVGQDLFIVKKTSKFSLAGLTIRTSKPASSDPNLWKGAGISFETNNSNTLHDVEIQEIEQGSSFKINAPGTYRVQSSRVPNWGFDITNPIFLSISDMSGHNIMKEQVKINAGETININRTFQPGIYIVQLKNKNRAISQKIIVH